MKEKIFSLLQQVGPLLPVEVASRAGIDSFMAKAYLSELIVDGKIKSSKEKIADSHLYYIPGHESQVQERLAQIAQQSQKTARIYAPSNVDVSPDVRAKRDAFAQRLREIEEAEQKRRPIQQKPVTTPSYRPQQLPSPVSLPFSKPTTPQPENKPFPKFEFQKEEPKREEFIDKAMDWLRTEGIDISEELAAKKNEVELIVKVRTDFGHTNFYVKIKQKKSITEPDLIAVYAAAMEQKCPGVLITNGKLAKSAENFLEEKGGTVKVKQLSL